MQMLSKHLTYVYVYQMDLLIVDVVSDKVGFGLHKVIPH